MASSPVAVTPDDALDAPTYNPRNFCSQITFAWAARLHDELAKRKMRIDELWQIPAVLESKNAAARLRAEWDKELKTRKRPSLFRAIFKSQQRRIIVTLTWMFFWLVSSCLTNALFLYNLLLVLQNPSTQPVVYIAGNYPVPWHGLPWAVAFGIGECGRTLSVNQQWWSALLAGMEVRAAVAELAVSKASRMRRIGADSKMTNLVTSDAQRLCEMLHYGTFLVSTPLTLLTVVIIGCFLLSIAFLAGLALLVLSVPVQSFIVRQGQAMRKRAVQITDERLRVMREILLAIKLVKLCAWEDSFAQRVHAIRQEEIDEIARAGDLKSANAAFSLVLPSLVILVAFAVHTLGLGLKLTPASAFSVIALLNVARFPLSVWPNALRCVSEGYVASQRLQALLESEEIRADEAPSPMPVDLAAQGMAIVVRNAEFAWTAQPSLFVPDMCVKRGQFVAVLGRTASGKSSLLAGALLGEMRRLKGECAVASPVAYVGQTPWLFNDTLKRNIVFQEPVFDEERFNAVLRKTGLVHDVASFPDGVLSELGERGINTSGGQRARIALARALYSSCELLVLDDPMSAVDQTLRLVLFEAIRDAVHVDGRTVVMATHAVDDLLEHFDLITLIGSNGVVAQPRTLSEIKAAGFAIDDFAEPPDADAASPRPADATLPATSSSSSFSVPSRGRLVNKDETGQVGRRTLAIVGKKAGWRVIPASVFVFASEGAVAVLGGVWVSLWTRNVFAAPNGFYVGVLAGVALLIFVMSFARGVAWSNLFLRGAAMHLHDDAFRALMGAKLSLFDTTSMGNLLNRFSTDVDKLDSVLPDLAETAVSLLFRCFASIVLVCVIYPYFLVMAPFLVLLYIFIVRRSRPALAQIKLLDAASKSPMLSHVEGAVGGLTSLRAWGATESSVAQAHVLIDWSTRSHLAYNAVARLTALRLDSITSLMALAVALLVVLLAHGTGAAFAGLALTTALQTSGLFQFGTRQFIETESQLSSVERIRWFIDSVPQEDDKGTQAVDATWPSVGRVAFEGLSARYRAGLDDVLNDFSLRIDAGSIGIVGRSGSGKSSLILALFRVLETTAGRITIDGVDIACVPLKTLRSKALSIVAQDPVLFRGTVRSNLDPWNLLEDAALERALAHCGVAGLSLEREVDEGGANFSAGERQLVCFARALLKDSRVVCVDEGTSSVDNQASDAMNRLIVGLFRGRTLIVVAHRLEAVLDLDVVCVMRNGRAVEVGPPRRLAAQEGGDFAKLYRQSSSSRRIFGSSGVAFGEAPTS